MSNSISCDKLSIAVTGTTWIGGGVGSVQSAIEALFNDAESEIQIAVYEITSGADDFLNKLNACLSRGIRVTMVINRYYDKPVFIKNRLELMAHKFPYLRILNFQPVSDSEDLHAKIIVVDRSKALVGSANLTWRGLVGNHELAVIVYSMVASKVANLLDRLCQDSNIVKEVYANRY